MNRLKKYFSRFLYALPFGLKGADKEIMGQGSVSQDGQNVQQSVTDDRVAEHLLKTEVTQAVKELRYRTYKVDDESHNYKYIGNGIAEKRQINRPKDRYKFSQECKLIPSNVLDELDHVNDYGKEEYTLKIKYNNPLVRFKIEEFATQIDVDFSKENFLTKIHFSSIPNGYEKKSAPFINELKKLLIVYNTVHDKDDEIKSQVYSHNEIASSIVGLSFITYKATNDESDLIEYTFENPNFYSIVDENNEIIITFKWEKGKRQDLKDKFYDPVMDAKYKNRAKKDVAPDMGNQERTAHCEICGKEMNVYDADVTKYTYGKAMCKECLEKYLKNKDK